MWEKFYLTGEPNSDVNVPRLQIDTLIGLPTTLPLGLPSSREPIVSIEL
jgi:hypothetical protein